MYDHLYVLAGRLRAFRRGDLKREEGQGVTEYGLALAFVIIVLATVLVALGGSISTFISQIGSDLSGLPGSI